MLIEVVGTAFHWLAGLLAFAALLWAAERRAQRRRRARLRPWPYQLERER